MPFQLITADTTNAAVLAVIGALKKKNSAGSRHIFIVPDKFSMSVEQEIFEQLELPGAVNIDVVSFTRLAVKELKTDKKPCLTKEGAVFLLKKVIDENAGSLTRYARAAAGAGFAKEMYAVIASFRNAGYAAEDIERAAAEAPPGTGGKLKDIALLYRAYLAELQTRDDSATRLERFAKRIEASEHIRESHVYVTGFHRFTKKQEDIIEGCMRHAKSVTVSCVSPSTESENAAVFFADAAAKLEKIAKNVGIDMSIDPPRRAVLPAPFAVLHDGLFAYGMRTQTAPYPKERLTLYREATVYDEAHAIAREIVRLVRREGYRYKDIAVVLCENAYRDIFDDIFNRYGISYFADKRYALKDTLPARYLSAVLETRLQNFRRDKVLKLVKSPLMGFSFEEQHAFENYLMQYNINYNRFTEPFSLGDFEGAEAVRLRVYETVSRVPQGQQGAERFAENGKALLAAADTQTYFLTALEELTAEGATELRAASEQALGRLDELLDEFAALGSAAEQPLAHHADLWKACLAASEFSLIPQMLDAVPVVSPAESCLFRVDALFLASATADTLPAEHRYQAIISAADAVVLENKEIPLVPSPETLAKEEMFLAADLMSKPKKRLYIGYALAAPDGTPARASAVITDAVRLTGTAVVSLAARYRLTEKLAEETLEDFAATERNAYFQYLYYAKTEPKVRGYENLKHALGKLRASFSSETEAAVQALLAPKERLSSPPADMLFQKEGGRYRTSVTQIEAYARCPYSHYLRHGIRLQERPVAAVEGKDIGIVIHDALSEYFKIGGEKIRAMYAADKKTCTERAVAAAEKAFHKHFKEDIDRDPVALVLLKRAKRETVRVAGVLTENLLVSRYNPVRTEARFGVNGDYPPLLFDIGGQTMELRGAIDRIDLYGKRAVVIDYKTYQEKGGLENVYYGKTVQLYGYLNVLKEAGFLPTAANYLPIRDTYSADGCRVTGQVADYPGMQEDFDSTLRARSLASGKTEASPNLPVNTKFTEKDGYTGGGENKLTAEAFAGVLAYTNAFMTGALQEMMEGNIARMPLETEKKDENPCGKCLYRAVCGTDSETRGRRDGEAKAILIPKEEKK